MPKWLQGMVAPTLMLWLYAIALALASSITPDGGLPTRADFAAQAALSMIIAWWVVADAHKRGRRLCHDYESFVYFAWVVVVPVYLFQTRGIRTFLTLLCFAGIWLLAALVSGLVFALRGSAIP
jgi:hypothetical protein